MLNKWRIPIKTIINGLLIYLCFFDQSQFVSSEPSQWFEQFCNNFGDALSTNTKGYTDLQRLIELYNKDNRWKPVALSPEDILETAKTKMKTIVSSAEEVVEKLAEKAQSFNDEYRSSKALKRSSRDDSNQESDILTSKKVRFYDKPPGERSASSAEVFRDGSNATMFYYNAKCESGHQLSGDLQESASCFVPESLSPDPRFGNNNVTYDQSAVHIPVDVYNEDPDVLRDIAWSQEMDSVFNSIYCNSTSNSSVRWSFIGTLSGVVRYFPASPWRLTTNLVDLYDGRSIVWFVQSMTSPKNVLIMIDASGSIVGLTLRLVRVSVKHVMKSLTRNDFFNVVVFNTTAWFLNKSCSGLLPASNFYKEMLMQWLDDNLTVSGASSFENGFDFAFSTLNSSLHRSNNNEERGGCNPVILLFTDGGAEYPDHTFEKWNDDKQTRVFSYSVGKHFASTTNVKRMACDNKGKFTTIPSDSATHFQTMEYLVTLSKPLAAASPKSKSNKWTLPYEDHLGLGTVLTVSRPFFDMYSVPSKPSHHRHIIQVAGIAGADVLYKDVEKALQVSEGSTTTYMFATENNGYLIYHPLLRRGRLDSPVMVDLMDMEIANVTQLRKAMIDGRNTELKIELEKLSLSMDKDHVSKTRFAYSYTSIPDNDLFSIGLAYPLQNQHWIYVTKDMPQLALSQLFTSNKNVSTIAYGVDCSSANDIPLCSTNGQPDKATVDKASSPSLFLVLDDESKVRSSCNVSAIDEQVKWRDFLFHGVLSREFFENRSADLPSNVLATFVAFDSKPTLLRILHNQNETSRQDIESSLSNPSQKDYFVRPLLDRGNSTQFYSLISVNSASEKYKIADTFDSPTDFDINSRSFMKTTAPAYTQSLDEIAFLVSEAVNLSREGKEVRPAVTGAVLRYDWVEQTLFKQAADQCAGEPEKCKMADCNDQEKFLCVLLDDGGLILVSNQDDHKDHIGKSFERVQSQFMSELVNKSLFSVNYIDDHQVVCRMSDNDENAARSSFFTPSLIDIVKSGWWFTSSIFLGIQSFLSLLFTSLQEVMSETIVYIPFNQKEFIEPNHNAKMFHCIVRKKVYSFGNTNRTESSKFLARRIKNTNLLFVIAYQSHIDNSTGKSECDPYSVVTFDVSCPRERMFYVCVFPTLPNLVNFGVLMMLYRKSIGGCYDASTKPLPEYGYDIEKDDDCGACQFHPSVGFTILLACLHFVLSYCS